MYNLNNKRFVVVDNENGLSSQKTVFLYYQIDDVITGDYRGGEILEGRFLGKYIPPDRMNMLFQCITREHALLSGEARGTVSKGDDGRLRLSYDWKWLSGDTGGGISSYIECDD